MIGYVLLFIVVVALFILAWNLKTRENSAVKQSTPPKPPVPPETPDEPEPTDIDSLDLNGRTRKALSDAGIETVEDLEEYRDDFTEIHGIGSARAEEIEEVLKQV